ncbi:MAG: L-seryl-tRNA(Sec) selenium transferase [Synergistaceae bacterium]|nr:L-seryl-tRNA(Sec) selenium transferase [Synergistaceae bacterium]
MKNVTENPLKSIPAMEALLGAPWAMEFFHVFSRETVKAVINDALGEIRDELREAPERDNGALAERVERHARALLRDRASGSLKRAVNATGVVVHTNLGRAPLSREAINSVANISGTYSTLEYSLENGERGSRNSHIEWSLCRLAGAEAALVVNNNAAAILLALSSLASGKEVLISRGELVEIGDSFRIPEILAFSGAKMIAVGCTNSTRPDDYVSAITENTAAILKVHPSNYRIEGFTRSTPREELAAVSKRGSLVFIEDLGSGLLEKFDFSGRDEEPTVRECIAQGADIVTFSGDKLLGGPQIGCVSGLEKLVGKMRRHQLFRALRADKMTISAFDATLRMYLAGRRNEIPVARMIDAPVGVLLKKARRLLRKINRALGDAGINFVRSSVVETEDAVGGGAYPTDTLRGLGVMTVFAPSPKPETVARCLRMADIPIIPGIRGDCLVFHVRTLMEGDERLIASSLASALAACDD